MSNENISDTLIEMAQPDAKSIIKVVGVGGGGGNAADYIYKRNISDVDFLAINTDQKALLGLSIPSRVELSTLGAGCKPEVAAEFANSHKEDIKAALNGSEMIFITAGLGKGTGTGASPIVAKVAKEMGILTIGVVTLPFYFEGSNHLERALEGLANVRKEADAVLIIANERIKALYGKVGLRRAFSLADEMVSNAVAGITRAVLNSSYVSMDMNDMRTMLTDAGDIMMGVGMADGPDRAKMAVLQAITSPLLLNKNLTDAKNILVNYAYSSEHEVTLDEIDEVNEELKDRIGYYGDQIWGTTEDESLGDKLRVTVVITGLDTVSDDMLRLASQMQRPKPKEENVQPVEQPVVVNATPAPAQNSIPTPVAKPAVAPSNNTKEVPFTISFGDETSAEPAVSSVVAPASSQTGTVAVKKVERKNITLSMLENDDFLKQFEDSVERGLSYTGSANRDGVIVTDDQNKQFINNGYLDNNVD